MLVFFFKQKTAYEMRISDWSSDVCSSDLIAEFSLSPFWRGVKRAGSSPPSPESDLAPMRFIAMLSVPCASGDSAPSDMPGVTKRLRIAVIDSTSPIGTAVTTSTLKSSRERRRSEQRRVGKACVRPGGSRESPRHNKQK